jgi:arylsulfatase
MFDFTHEGEGMTSLASGASGIGNGGTGVLKVDGKEVASKRMARTVPLILQWDETFDVGADTGTPVDDADYQVPFRFTGKLNKLTLQLKPVALSAADRKMLRERARRNNAVSH